MKIISNIQILVRRFVFLLLISVSIWSCSKVDPVVHPPLEAHFTNKTNGAFFVTPTNTQFKIFVGLTETTLQDRVVNFTVSSPTGAVAGTHYNIVGGNSVTIKAGKALDSITINGVVAAYASGRKDSVIFTITDGTTKASSYNKVFKLFMRGPCFDSDINFPDLLGSYTKTFENGSYGPYTSTITGYSAVNATSGTASITNIYDSGITGVATFDFSTVGSFSVTVADQPTQFTSGGNRLFLRTTPGTTSTFTYCVPKFTIYLDLYTSAGLYDRWVMTMAR